jgi:hypothetical protein
MYMDIKQNISRGACICPSISIVLLVVELKGFGGA